MVLLTVVVVPFTVRLPVIVTSLGKPTVTVPDDSPTSTSLAVPCIVSVPPPAMADVLEPSLI